MHPQLCRNIIPHHFVDVLLIRLCLECINPAQEQLLHEVQGRTAQGMFVNV